MVRLTRAQAVVGFSTGSGEGYVADLTCIFLFLTEEDGSLIHQHGGGHTNVQSGPAANKGVPYLRCILGLEKGCSVEVRASVDYT